MQGKFSVGDEIEIPTLDGKASLKIPPGVQTNKVFRLKNRGVPHSRGSGRGDQLVRIQIFTPQALDDSQKKLFAELAKTLGEATLVDEDKGFFKNYWFNLSCAKSLHLDLFNFLVIFLNELSI